MVIDTYQKSVSPAIDQVGSLYTHYSQSYRIRSQLYQTYFRLKLLRSLSQ